MARKTYVRVGKTHKWVQKIITEELGLLCSNFGHTYDFDLCPGKDFLTHQEMIELHGSEQPIGLSVEDFPELENFSFTDAKLENNDESTTD